MNLGITIGSAGKFFYGDRNGITSEANLYFSGNANTSSRPAVELVTSTTQQINIKCDTPTATVNATVLGWTDFRGK